jgi:hypothetical protein
MMQNDIKHFKGEPERQQPWPWPSALPFKSSICIPYLPAIFNVLVDDGGQSDGNQSIEPTRHEHDGDAERSSYERQRPENGK